MNAQPTLRSSSIRPSTERAWSQLGLPRELNAWEMAPSVMAENFALHITCSEENSRITISNAVN